MVKNSSLSPFCLFLAMLLAPSAVFAGQFTGTWNSDYGELRIHETSGVIIGDYAGVGVLLGEVAGNDCASGVFTNGGRFGEFSFRVEQNGRIAGRYRWADGSGAAKWNATRKSASIPAQFKNFTRTGGSTQHIENDNNVFSGVYDSSYGTLRLRDSDLFLFGDYAGRGVIAARWNGRIYEGIFTNRELKDNQVGWVEWNADVLGRNLSGGRFQIQGGASGNWSINNFRPGDVELQNIAVPGACAPLWPF